MSSETFQSGETAAPSGHTGNKYGPGLGLLLVMLGIGVRVSRYQRLSIIGTGDVTGIANFSISKTLVLLAAAVLCAYILMRPRTRILRVDLPSKFLCAYLIWELISYFWALYPSCVVPEALRTAFKVAIYALVITYTVDWDDIRRWGHLLMYMSIGFFIVAAYEGLVIGWWTAATRFGFRLYMGICARWSTFILPFNLHYVSWGRTRFERGLGGFGILMNLGTIYITTRRAPLVVLPAVLLVYMILIGYRRKALVVATLLVGLLMPVFIMSNPEYAARVDMTMRMLAGDLDVALRIDFGRMTQYLAGLQAAKEYWPVGMGIGSFKWWVRDVYGFHKDLTLHNLILHLVVQVGIVGLLLYGGFLASGFRRLWQSWKFLFGRETFRKASLVAAMISALVGLLVYALFQPIQHEIPMYLTVAIGSATWSILRQEQLAEASPTPVATDASS